MGTQDWASQAVARLESLETERVAIQEQRATAIDGNNERRLDEISKTVEELYAKLNTEAEQIAVQVESLPDPPAGPRPPDLPDEGSPKKAAGPPPPPRSPRSIDTVVVEHPAKSELHDPQSEFAAEGLPRNFENWLEDERLQLRGAFQALEKSQVERSRASEDASKSLEGQAQELAELKAQAQAARLVLQRFEETQASVETRLAAAQERLAKRREQERQAKLDLATMEAKLRTEFKLLVGLDKIRERVGSVDRALKGAISTAEQERALLAKDVDQALDAAERATRQAEEMRDAAERAHQRAQQAIAHAQEVETRSEVREQEIVRVLDGLEGQMAGLKHERSSIEQQLQELRGDEPESEALNVPSSLIGEPSTSGARTGSESGSDAQELPN